MPTPFAYPIFFFIVVIPGIIQRMPFGAEMIIRRLTIDRLAGKTLREVDPTNRYDCQVIAIRRRDETDYRYIPKADDMLSDGDIIVAIGTSRSLARLKL